MNGPVHDHGLPPHHFHSPAAAAHTAGTSKATPTTTQARANPTQTLVTHDTSGFMMLLLAS
jgi:hypothetical protein